MEGLWLSRTSPRPSVKMSAPDMVQAAPRFMPGSFQYETDIEAEGEMATFHSHRGRTDVDFSDMWTYTTRYGDTSDTHTAIWGSGRDSERCTRRM